MKPFGSRATAYLKDMAGLEVIDEYGDPKQGCNVPGCTNGTSLKINVRVYESPVNPVTGTAEAVYMRGEACSIPGHSGYVDRALLNAHILIREECETFELALKLGRSVPRRLRPDGNCIECGAAVGHTQDCLIGQEEKE